ncbi:putative adhesin/invasin [Campylobacter iguaniorum]|uniref:inverse autotransporter beta domain-containing protein n=1 Tax=Campylobacter iguaniorum TaxID=1244531 RepID=UPI00073A1DF2|nr:inverse autotransporter beta domain-containing protein [Campylobacter iguaniorum]ALV24682.1 putative adhesin/invasin [Campylobacter iguaniorum]
MIINLILLVTILVSTINGSNFIIYDDLGNNIENIEKEIVDNKRNFFSFNDDFIIYDDLGNNIEDNPKEAISQNKIENPKSPVDKITSSKPAKVKPKIIEKTEHEVLSTKLSVNKIVKIPSPTESINLNKINTQNSKTEQQAELEKTQQKSIEIAQTASSLIQTEDKSNSIKSFVANYASGKINQGIKEFIDSYANGARSEISFRYDTKNHKMNGSGKVLVPYTSDDFVKTVFIQNGVGQFNNRWISHAGAGIRFFPDAKSYTDVGNLMFGFNTVYDYDLSRYHQRLSVGAEVMYKNLLLTGNLYERLTSWRNSKDFESGYVEERPANGYDIKVKFAIPDYERLAFTAGIQKWHGDRVSLFGDTTNLETNPTIYSGGIEYSPIPMLTLSAEHSKSSKNKKNTNFNLKFNVPLYNDDALKRSMNPKYADLQNTLQASRTNFIERDYSMPLEYRSTLNKYYITYCGYIPDDKHCFMITNGFHEAVPDFPVAVRTTDDCVKLDNSGNYITNKDGKVYATIIGACKPTTTLIVTAGSVTEKFPINIKNLSFKLKALPTAIERHEKSVATLNGGTLAANLAVTWRLKSSKGSLTNQQNTTDANGVATAEYVPEPTQIDGEKVDITATVYSVEFETPVIIKVFGNNPDDISIDRTVIGENEYAKVIYKNLRPNTNVTFRIDGTGGILTDKTTDFGTNASISVNEAGEAIIYVKGQDLANSNLKVFAKNSDPLVSEKSVNLNIKNYTADMTLPTWNSSLYGNHQNTIDYKENFKIKVSNLMPNTTVTWSATNGATPNATTSQVAKDGTTEMNFGAISDFAIKDTDISIEYNKNESVKTSMTKKLNLYQYQLNLTTDKSEIIGDEQYVATLSGGKPGERVVWTVTGDSQEISKEEVFDENGKAKYTAQGKSPFDLGILLNVNALKKSIKKNLPNKMPSNFSNYIYANNSCAGAGWNVTLTRVGKTLDYTLSFSLAGDYNWFYSNTVTLNYMTNPTYEYSAWWGRDSSGIKVDLRQGKVWGLYCRAGWGQIGTLF